MGRLRRELLVGFAAALVAWAGALVYLALEGPGDRGASPSAQTAVPTPEAGALRGNQLPEGIAGRPAPDFRLTDARGRSIETRTPAIG